MKKNFRLLPLTALVLLCWHPGASPTVSSGTSLVAWTKTAFDATNGKLFVAESAAGGAGALANQNGGTAVAADEAQVGVYNLKRSNITGIVLGQSVPVLTGLTPVAATVSVNGGVLAASPLNNKKPALLTLTPSGKPVVAHDSLVGGPAAAQDLYLFQDAAAGTKLLKSNLGLEDTAHVKIPTGSAPVSIAASDDYVVAAVPGAAAAFGAMTSGFALARVDPAALTLVKASDGVAGPVNNNNAYKLNPDTQGDALGSVSVLRDGEAAAAATDVTVAAGADICYDAKLDRFFVGLKDVNARGGVNIANVGAITDLLVGRLVTNDDGTKQLVMRAAVNTEGYMTPGVGGDTNEWKKVFTDNNKAQIIGMARPVKGAGAALVANNGVTARKVRTMHTSTGKDYVVINGGSAVDITAAGTIALLGASVFALPVLPKTLDATGKDDGKAGIIAMIDPANGANPYLPVGVGKVQKSTDDATKVGVLPAYLGHKAAELPAIQDMHVAGDTVYVSVAGDRRDTAAGNAAEAGVFASTALFNEDGNVRAWTPWERAGTSIDNAYGFGVDQKTGDIWYLTSDTGIQAAANDKKVVKVTQWSKGDVAADAHGADVLNTPLADTAATKFPTTGVLKIFNFDDETLGFAKPQHGHVFAGAYGALADSFPSFSMAVATGMGQVALAATGQYKIAPTGAKRLVDTFQPTLAFAGALHGSAVDAPVIVYNAVRNPDLAKLGTITTAEVAREGATAGKGWLFVGGKGGLAVLRIAAGTGWEARPDQATSLVNLANGATDPAADVPGGTDWSFKQLTKFAVPDGAAAAGFNRFADTRKIVCDGVFMYVLTKDKLYRMTMDSTAFSDAGGAVAIPEAVVSPRLIADISTMKNTSNVAIFDAAADEFYDMMLVDGTADHRKLLVATSKGLWVSPDITNAIVELPVGNMGIDKTGIYQWKKPYDKTGADDKFECGTVLKLDFVSAQRGGKMSAGDMVSPASGNLYVTAVDKNDENVCVYRFNVSGGTVKAFKEQYTETASDVVATGPVTSLNNTDYFYKIGSVKDLAGDISLGDAFDMQPQSNEYGNHGVAGDFLGGVAMTPDPAKFLNAGKKNSAIDLGADLSNGFQLANVVKDTASGALYIPGQFGVRVNE